MSTSKKEKQQSILSLSILGVMLAAGFWAVWASEWGKLLFSPVALREAVLSFGPTAPLIIFAVHAAQVVFAPIPGQAIDFAAGYIYGPLWGTLLAVAAISFGSLVAIFLAQQFGRPIVSALITPAGLKRIERYIHRGQWFFFILFLLPGTPDDILCFAIGLSPIPFWRAVLITILGRAPGVAAAALFGATGQSLSPIEFLLIAAALSILMGLIFWRSPIMKLSWFQKAKRAVKNLGT